MFDTTPFNTRFQAATAHFTDELKKVRTGRAHPSMLDGITVEAYGSPMPLNQVATVSAPEGQLLQITPFDPGNIQAIASAIRADQSLGLNPSDDGRAVRVPVPSLTEERRKQLVKQTGEKVEEARIALRNVRQDALKEVRRQKDVKQLTEDDASRAEKSIDELMAVQVAAIDQLFKEKRERYPYNLMADNSITPSHVGYIIDGNRRWAKKHGLPTYEGHLAGYNALKEVAFASLESGIKYMSIYIFSTENWKRSQEEIKGLMSLIFRLFTTDAKVFDDNNIKLRIMGSREGLDEKALKAMDKLEKRTESNTAGTLVVCLNYGGQNEIVDAVKKIVQTGVDAEDITQELITENLYAAEVPPLDVIVRTSGEKRLSNFMLWRSAYSEFIFLDKLWPDMTKADVSDIIEEYSRRHRRFGG